MLTDSETVPSVVVYAKNAAVLCREEDDAQYLVFEPTNSVTLIMNRTAFMIWNACDGVRSAEAIAELVREACDGNDVPDEELRGIVTQHLELLAKARLIQSVSAA